MQTYYTIAPILIALILVVVKLLLENQQQKDRLAGCEDVPEHYTFWGLIKMMRTERKEKKQARKEEKSARKQGKKMQKTQMSEPANNAPKVMRRLKR